MSPFWGRPKDDPIGGTYDELGLACSPISKGAFANEYTSEKTRGSRGIFPRIPHLWLEDDSSATGVGDWLRRETGCWWGISKIWRVDLSEVTANKVLDGEKATENITA
jgi:hypothetical protein